MVIYIGTSNTAHTFAASASPRPSSTPSLVVAPAATIYLVDFTLCRRPSSPAAPPTSLAPPPPRRRCRMLGPLSRISLSLDFDGVLFMGLGLILLMSIIMPVATENRMANEMLRVSTVDGGEEELVPVIHLLADDGVHLRPFSATSTMKTPPRSPSPSPRPPQMNNNNEYTTSSPNSTKSAALAKNPTMP
ncbi:uncharacterized protein A4U43_C04F5460 [Asparagus officinalis]|uniref:Uncharacterized protein n=1 Tax=Asparagus officinalis TaxID=4686 RepID=A0A5P1F0A6_ASPOF|nr:uncharacterized protein A4U43_C04F5460 [Asparagus officinalis]